MKKSSLILLLTLVSAMSWQIVSHAAVERGLFFKSYETTPIERTSLQIPAQGTIPFSDSLRVGFSMKVNLDLGRFGYICRVLLSNMESVDVLLYTPSGRPTSLCATGDHENLLFLPLDPSGWQNVDILITLDEGVVKASLNGELFASISTGAMKESVTLYFGKNQMGGAEITTADVAPMVIRDLSVKADRHKADFRSLDCDDSHDARRHKYSSAVENPLWMMERYRHWNRIHSTDFPSVSHVCPCKGSNIYFISDGIVENYDVRRMSCKSWRTSANIRMNLVTNDFICLEDGTLAYLDIDVPNVICFDAQTHDWTMDNPRTRRSVHLHDNIVYDNVSGNYLRMFGYGQHRYSNELDVWNPSDGSVSRRVLADISPRYLAAVGVYGRELYVFGGKGNVQGAQELGSRLYDDLWAVNLDDFSTRQIWESEDNCQEIAASDLVFSEDGTSFYALMYNPNLYDSGLHLRKFNLEDRSCESFAEPIPYNFLDIQSEAHLLYCADIDSYLAVICHKNGDGNFKTEIYSIGSPVLPPEEQESATLGGVLPYAAFAAVLLLAVCVLCVFLSRRRRSQPIRSQLAPQASVQKPEAGVHLLGGFKVISSEGMDLSGNFSPLMKQLLCIIILNSGRKGGISNSALKDALWFDKSDESYNNNRGVTLKKIRTILSQVNPQLAIVSNRGSWLIEDPDGVCDFITVSAVLSDRKASLASVIEAASHGPLLPELHFDWLDQFKSDYDYLVISRLSSFRTEISDDKGAETAIMIADALLSFDRLDESSVRMKCQALLHLKRTGSAKRAFDAYVEDYRRTLDEEFPLSFTDFIKNQAR